jgi:hypothetical protein
MEHFQASAETGCASLPISLAPAGGAANFRDLAAKLSQRLLRLWPGRAPRRAFSGGVDSLTAHLLRDIGLEDKPTAYWNPKRKVW